MHAARPGDLLTLDVEKPAAGGRMLARREGQVVLVWGAIPGERVQARIERAGKGLLYADTIEVLSASPDRRAPGMDWRCGGNVFAHVAYARQVALKGEIIQDALGRIGRVPLPAPPGMIGSPEQGYRMRARLHPSGGRIGFFREGTHEICSAGATGQLAPATNAWIAAAQEFLQRERGLAGIEIAENIPGDQRAVHLELHEKADVAPFAALASVGSLTGLSAQRSDSRTVEQLAGEPFVTDTLHLPGGADASPSGPEGPALRLRREVRAFFQGNRFLLEHLVRHVASLVPAGPVVDLYAGVGLFGLAIAATGAERVTLVEGDPVSGTDLQVNAEPFGARVRVEHRSVESYLRSMTPPAHAAFIVDPPRTGLSKDALAGIVRHRPSRIVYVSCDVATLARDTRTLLDAGYELNGLTGIDLFPNTAHVETIADFVNR
ncbi:MAG TPA: TRAM domain-containing protein [Vicinamibacterales bacterium]